MKYDDILEYEYHGSISHPHMSMEQRAAQFAPFAALVGYSDNINEAKRLTQEQRDLGESDILDIDYKLQYIESIVQDYPLITVTYFKKDEKKAGGEYLTKTGNVRKIDTYQNYIEFMDRDKVSLNTIMYIEIEKYDD